MSDSTVKREKIANQSISLATVNEPDANYRELFVLVDSGYFNWLIGKSNESCKFNAEFKKNMIEYLGWLAESESAGANLVGRIPDVTLQLLRKLHERDVSTTELTLLILKDVVLLASILKEVNSSFFNSGHEINKIGEAILLLGHNRLRLLIARHSFMPVYSHLFEGNLKSTSQKIWDVSQRRALIGYLLAKTQKVDPFNVGYS